MQVAHPEEGAAGTGLTFRKEQIADVLRQVESDTGLPHGGPRRFRASCRGALKSECGLSRCRRFICKKSEKPSPRKLLEI